MAADIVGEVLDNMIRPIVRFVFIEIFLHFFFERIIQGTGYAICRRFDPHVDPDGWVVALIGTLIWSLTGAATYFSIMS